jgi:hypothetical protein
MDGRVVSSDVVRTHYIFAPPPPKQCLIFPKMHFQLRWQHTRKMDLNRTGWKGMDWIDLAEDGDR